MLKHSHEERWLCDNCKNRQWEIEELRAHLQAMTAHNLILQAQIEEMDVNPIGLPMGLERDLSQGYPVARAGLRSVPESMW